MKKIYSRLLWTRVSSILLLIIALSACSTSLDTPDIGMQSDIDALPQPGTLTSPVEDYAGYDGEPYGCPPAPGEIVPLKPGPAKFQVYLEQFGIVANTYVSGCRESFHQAGQALDIYTSDFQAFADWLTANDGEMAKRLGIVQIIWNEQMWRSYPKDGKPAGVWGKGSGHKDHIHLSFSHVLSPSGTSGADGTTSFFTEVIDGASPPPPPAPEPTPPPVPPALSWPTLALDSPDHSLVKTFQYLMNANGANLAVDGDFGPQTELAVKFIQGLNGWEQTGVVGESEWRSVTEKLILYEGVQGNLGYDGVRSEEAVRAVQQRFTDKGIPLEVDGIFGSETREAVSNFQKFLGITSDGDGVVGPDTWLMLISWP